MKKEKVVVGEQLKKHLVKSLKIAGWFLLSFIFLLIALILVVRIPSVQNRIVQKAISFLEGKIGTEVSVRKITISFPKKIVLEEFFLLDQTGDTLLYAGELDVDANVPELLKHHILFNKIELAGLRTSIKRQALDTTFNFDYIIKAFASGEPADSTSTPWVFSINEVVLKNTHLSYHDAYGGNTVDLRIGHAGIRMDEFDPEKSIFRFDDIRLADLTARIEQKTTLSATVDPDTIPHAFHADISLKKADLKNIKAEYAQITLGERIILDLGEAQLQADHIDLRNKIIHLENFELANTLISYQQSKKDEEKESVKEDTVRVTAFNIPWSLKLQELTLTNNSIQYYNFNEDLLNASMDFNHLWIYDFNAAAQDIMIENQAAHIDLHSLSFKEKNGFELRSLSITAALAETELNIENLLLKTKHSRIETSAHAKFDALGTLKGNSANAQIELDINHSIVSLGDILLFYPSIADSLPLKLSPSTLLLINADAYGQLNNLTLRGLQLKTLDSTLLETKGIITGLPNLDHTSLNLEIEKFYTTRADMNRLLGDSLLPASIGIPRWVNVKGKLGGTFHTPKFSAFLTSSAGAIQAEGRVDLNGIEGYEAKIKTEALDLGQILKQKETMGKLDLEGVWSGTGSKLEDLDAKFDLTVSSFEYRQYAYRDFILSGTLKKYLFSCTAILHDKNLDFTLKGNLDYADDIPHYQLSFDLKNIDFQALNLTENPIRARGKLDVDLATSDFKVINGRVDIRKVAVFNGTDLYAVDSLLYASIDQDGQTEISIRSDILSGDFKGTINLFAMPEALRQHLNQYFAYRDDFRKSTAPQNFSFDLIIKNTDLLTEIILPELEPFKPGEIKGDFNSLENKLDLRIKVSKLKYATAGVDSLVILVDSDKDALNYSFAVKNFVADTLQIDELNLKGSIANDSIHTAFKILDASEKKEKYILGGIITSLDDKFRFHFIPGQVILNSGDWGVPNDNFLEFGSGNLHANHFDISRGHQKIALLTSANTDSVISIVFTELELGNLTRMVGGVVPASGELNGDLKFTTTGRGAFNSNLRITDMTVLQKGWGDVSLLLNYAAGKYTVDLQVKGNNTNLSARGYYSTIQDPPVVNITATLAPFNLELIQPWSFGHLQQVSGIAQGSLAVKGTPKSPSILGEVSFKDAAFFSTYLNNSFTLKNERISFRESGILLSNFTVLDNQDNVATLSGSINTTSYQEFDLNLRLGAKDFQVLNTTGENNALYYGRMKINLDARVTGTTVEPKVVINAGLSDDSEVTYVVPQEERAVLEQEGIVKFVDKDAQSDPFLASIQSGDTLQSSFSGLDLSATISLSGKETLNIIIDPIAGDKLSVRGHANLSFDLDPSGNMNLAGRYEISLGSYELSFYKLVKRKFDIQTGSSLTWSGDPLNASMDIRASHLVETSPIDLISNQLTTVDESMARQYRQRLPFLVYLIIRGELLTPQISFSLDMPMEKRNVLGGAIYARLQDVNTRESDLNKQVFALLILRRFVSENPFDSQAGGALSNTTRTSVSRLLSEQLNRLSENVKGVQLSFDVKSYEDYSSGAAQGRTQAQLGLSKSLFDDRLVVKLSGNVDIEGEDVNQDEVTDYIGDLALEYKMTPDGRFRVTGFRNSNYDMIDGELTETGAGLIYIKDYNTLRKLLKPNAKAK